MQPNQLRLRTALVSILSLHSVRHVAGDAPTIDLTNPASINAATQQAITNLMTYYSDNSLGVFDQTQTPWFMSGVIWNTLLDSLKWGGNNEFASTAIWGLSNATFGTEQDALGGAQAEAQGLLGKWNDDILWYALATISGGEIYGANTTMPYADGSWLTMPQKTLDEAYEQYDDLCGGGIYWSRNRAGSSADYKSLITNLEWVSTAAQVYMQTQNETLMTLATGLLEWMYSSGLATSAGVLNDGVSVNDCSAITTDQWSYTYGQALGMFAWLYLATGNSTYLSMASPVLTNAISTFAPNGVIIEQCEPAGTCNRDQVGFKAIFARNLAYYARQTQSSSEVSAIKTLLQSTLNSMISHSCDSNWNCGGNWTTDTGVVKYVASQHDSTALLVAIQGVFQQNTGSGLNPTNIGVNASSISTTSTSSTSKCTTSGSVTTCPLDSAASHTSRFHHAIWLGIIGWIIALSY